MASSGVFAGGGGRGGLQCSAGAAIGCVEKAKRLGGGLCVCVRGGGGQGETMPPRGVAAVSCVLCS